MVKFKGTTQEFLPNGDPIISVSAELSDATRQQLSSANRKWDDPSYGEEISGQYDYRSAIIEKYREGDSLGIINAHAPKAQLNLVTMAEESKDERIKFEANKLIVSQAGFGPQQKVEHSVVFDQMETRQLQAVVRSKLLAIKKRDPSFDLGNIVKVDYEVLPDVSLPKEEVLGEE